MLDAGRQIWKIRVPKDVELIPQKNKSEQEQNKDNEKEPREIKKNNDEKNERWMKGQWKMIFHEMILG